MTMLEIGDIVRRSKHHIDAMRSLRRDSESDYSEDGVVDLVRDEMVSVIWSDNHSYVLKTDIRLVKRGE